MKILMLALSLALASCASAPKPESQAKAGPNPGFLALDQNGKEWSLDSSNKKPLLVDFWATWCVPCLRSIPELKAFRDKHGDKITLIGASTDEKGWDVVKPAIARFKIDYPIILASPELAQAYGVSGYPYLVLIKDGLVRKQLLGRHSLADLEEKLAAYLK